MPARQIAPLSSQKIGCAAIVGNLLVATTKIGAAKMATAMLDQITQHAAPAACPASRTQACVAPGANARADLNPRRQPSGSARECCASRFSA
jgi:hypothetical protein